MFRMTYTSKAGQRESLDFDTREAAIRYARQEYGIPVAYWTLNGGYTVEVSYYGETVKIAEAPKVPAQPEYLGISTPAGRDVASHGVALWPNGETRTLCGRNVGPRWSSPALSTPNQPRSSSCHRCNKTKLR